MSFLNGFRKKYRTLKNINISKNININIINGKIETLSSEDEELLYRILYNKKRNILMDLGSAIEMYSIKHIINKKDKFAEVEYCCKICLENPINIATLPCGHLFCNPCYLKSNNICYNCRSHIKSVVKIYS
jgi:hypothetical protein